MSDNLVVAMREAITAGRGAGVHLSRYAVFEAPFSGQSSSTDPREASSAAFAAALPGRLRATQPSIFRC